VKARYGDHFSDPSNIVTVSIVAADDPTLPTAEMAPRLTPNPFSGTAKLSFGVGDATGSVRVSLYNAKGRKLGERECSVKAGINEIPLDPLTLGLFDSGVFFLRLQISGEIILLRGLFIR